MARSTRKRRDGGKTPAKKKPHGSPAKSRVPKTSPIKVKRAKSPKKQSDLSRAKEESLLDYESDLQVQRDIEEALNQSLTEIPPDHEAIALSLQRSTSHTTVDYDISPYTEKNILETGGGGACLFTSLAYELNRLGIEIRHQELRKMICNKLEELLKSDKLLHLLHQLHGEGIDEYITQLMDSMDADNFEEAMTDYIEYMGNMRSWGSELEMMIFKVLYPEVNLLLYRENKGNYVLQSHFPWGNTMMSGQFVRLYGDGVHFQVMEDNDDKIEDEDLKKQILKFIVSRPPSVKKSPVKKRKSLFSRSYPRNHLSI